MSNKKINIEITQSELNYLINGIISYENIFTDLEDARYRIDIKGDDVDPKDLELIEDYCIINNRTMEEVLKIGFDEQITDLENLYTKLEIIYKSI
jgi:hypothetical protein